MWSAIALAAVGLFFFYHLKRRADVAGQAGSAHMLGFHWGDSVDAVAKWAKKLGLRYQNADNAAACIVYTGKFPSLMQAVSYTFHLPGGRLDSIAILAEDASGFSSGKLRDRFAAKYGEPWDEEPGNASWVVGDDEILLVVLQGDSGYAHIRFFNMENLDGRNLEEVHDDVIGGIRLVDAEIVRQAEARKHSRQ